MFSRIVVPLDGSARARQAIPVAARIARACEGSIVLLSVLSPPLDLASQAQLALTPPEDWGAEHKKIARELARLAASEELEGVESVTEVTEGSPAAVILDRARALQADLIVLCSHGRTGITRWALGSVAQKVARQSPVPVLILREGRDVSTSEPPQILQTRPIHVMVALDGSPLAERALLPAVQLSVALSAPFHGALHLVRVLPFSTAFEYNQDDAFAHARRQEFQKAEEYLHAVQQWLLEKNHDIYVRTSIATSMDTAETLIELAETGEGEGMRSTTEACDIIALATHGRSGPTRWVMGSIAERMLGATRLPLLIVRPSQQEVEPGAHQEYNAEAS